MIPKKTKNLKETVINLEIIVKKKRKRMKLNLKIPKRNPKL